MMFRRSTRRDPTAPAKKEMAGPNPTKLLKAITRGNAASVTIIQ
jgi:hypothetical protein